VLLTATYETSGDDIEDEDRAVVDVTVPLQAQVRDSQLMIPGGRSKVRYVVGGESRSAL